MIVSPYTHDIEKLIRQLKELKNISKIHNNEEVENWMDLVLEIVIEWKFDNSQLDFRSDHYRQAVSFLMRIAEETPTDEYPEYFQERFYETMKYYKALKHRYEEREKKK